MSSFALILFFLMLLAYIQNLVTGNNLKATEELLASTQTSLTETQASLEEKSTALTETLTLLDETTAQVTEAQDQLNQIQKDLKDTENELKGQQKTVTTQQALIKEQEDYLAAANEEILEMRSQMQTIAVLRLSILEQIKNSIIEVTGDSSKVSISDTGNIMLNEGVFFDLGSYEIKPESSQILNQIVQVFNKFLADEENTKYIDTIMISGHTDDIGTEESNRVLANNRANAVLEYLLAADNGSLNKYAQYFCASGYGETRPVASNDTAEGQAQNRRIEISIILKDDSVMDIVEQYLEIDVPSSASTGTES